MINKLILSFTICFLYTISINSQVILIDNGTSYTWTKYSSKENFSYKGGISFNYLEKDYFMFSIGVSYIRLKESRSIITENTNRFNINIDYIDITTTARLKKSLDIGNIYWGIGPSLKYKLRSKYTIEGVINQNEERSGKFISENIVLGLLTEIGYFYDINKLRFDLRIGYTTNITRIIPERRKGMIANTLYSTFGIGYIF